MNAIKGATFGRKLLSKIALTVLLSLFGIAVFAAQNIPPKISGIPVKSINVGKAYRFVPVASDPNKDKLTFTIANKPTWASFNITTGALTGIPTAAKVGITKAITIIAS
ncbi:MAG: putative Ig domain-containing protein [Methyloglobulus sp.]|nr:hypothetical protein [Methyloglobulus sp.]